MGGWADTIAGFTAEHGYWLLAPIPIAGMLAVVAAVWRRPKPPGVASPNWVLILTPTVFATSTLSRTVGAVGALALAGWVLWFRPPPQLKLVRPCYALPVVALLIVMRWHDPKTMIKAGFFVLACVILIRAVTTSASKTSAIVSLIDGAGLFTAASVALWALGIAGAADRTGGLWNTITGGPRIIFPLSGSLAATPAVAAVYLAAIVPVLITYRRWRIYRLIGVGCAAAVLVLADSRSGLIAAVAIGISAAVAPRLFRRAAPLIVGVLLVAPFIYSTLQNAVERTLASLSGAAPWLVRPTLNRRDYIWERALAHYQDRIDPLHQLLGYGANGQARSGAVGYYWARQYGDVGNVERASPHNSMLQILFDGGAFTVIVFIAIIVCAAWALRTQLAGLAALTALVVVSTTDSALSPGHAQPAWWLLITIVMITFARGATESIPNPSGQRSASCVAAPSPH